MHLLLSSSNDIKDAFVLSTGVTTAVLVGALYGAFRLATDLVHLARGGLLYGPAGVRREAFERQWVSDDDYAELRSDIAALRRAVDAERREDEQQ